jgi:prepilin-type N-terminal cleavage/methylation domain-containing protein/prepilin-type processing-associated H-X9-DG protein
MRGRNRGFTLVELMVVVGIIAMLLAILLPSLNRARGQAMQVACLSNLRQIAIGFILYCNDNGGWLPHAAHYSTSTLPESPADWIWWQQASAYSARNRDVYYSPILRYLGCRPDMPQRPTRTDFDEIRQKVLRCPADALWDHPEYVSSDDLDGNYYYSYTLNDLISSIDPNSQPEDNTLPVGPQGQRFRVAGKLVNVRRPALKVMIIDEATTTIDDGSFDPGGGLSLLSIRHDPTAQQPEDLPVGYIQVNGVWTIRNGNCRGNVSFCDGHAEYVTRDYVNNPGFEVNGILASTDPYY